MFGVGVHLVFETSSADERFWLAFAEALKDVSDLLAQRSFSGRDSILPMMSKFPHGKQDLTFMMHAKVNRILGLEKQLKKGAPIEIETSLRKEMRQEVLDLIAWTGFLCAFMKVEDEIKSLGGGGE